MTTIRDNETREESSGDDGQKVDVEAEKDAGIEVKVVNEKMRNSVAPDPKEKLEQQYIRELQAKTCCFCFDLKTGVLFVLHYGASGVHHFVESINCNIFCKRSIPLGIFYKFCVANNLNFFSSLKNKPQKMRHKTQFLITGSAFCGFYGGYKYHIEFVRIFLLLLVWNVISEIVSVVFAAARASFLSIIGFVLILLLDMYFLWVVWEFIQTVNTFFKKTVVFINMYIRTHIQSYVYV
ncbi:hypothetical protein RFI_07826 [Reticulomyxa filosa]|uniref:Uncharacterized protein n=1 Tax=Reticulomyxa filosa TaxID=46433 RepID=X6NSM7_RETFI|nr:hypothetical protein RFI_07826 [Reticulomyxa filosa]|eukprot:ETO29295.1 hypothetical protein RFI_07826 [Reticulomyxa filosa]